ncbi:MAG: hypothetical protein M3Q39_16610 [Actinomycetota bacterium]|nr:hypothetical protein [Actinomycetota bacterium]
MAEQTCRSCGAPIIWGEFSGSGKAVPLDAAPRLPVDPDRRVDCECKLDEQTIVEADGYQWTTPADGPCRGCEFELTIGKPCTIHRSQAAAP